jgi:diamine N-acetyltransferase
MLTTTNICLRALEPEDLDLLYSWENDASEWHAGDTLSPYSRYELRRHIDSSRRSIFEENQLRLMIEQSEPHRSAGLVDLYAFDPHHRKAAVGITIDKACRRQGLATLALELICRYAFEVLLLHQLYGYIAAGNDVSLRLFDRCGFSPSGTLADWIARPDGYEDVRIVQRINPQTAQLRGIS